MATVVCLEVAGLKKELWSHICEGLVAEHLKSRTPIAAQGRTSGSDWHRSGPHGTRLHRTPIQARSRLSVRHACPTSRAHRRRHPQPCHSVNTLRWGAGNGGPFRAHVLRRAERTAGAPSREFCDHPAAVLSTLCGGVQAMEVRRSSDRHAMCEHGKQNR